MLFGEKRPQLGVCFVLLEMRSPRRALGQDSLRLLDCDCPVQFAVSGLVRNTHLLDTH